MPRTELVLTGSSRVPRDWPEWMKRWPGRNRPGLGVAIARHLGVKRVVDPMCGVFQLWVGALAVGLEVVGVDVQTVGSGLVDLEHYRVIGNAENCKLPYGVALGVTQAIVFSPPYPQSHSAGATEHQRQITVSKHLHAMQEFAAPPPNMPKVYRNLASWRVPVMAVIVRDHIRKGKPKGWPDLNVLDAEMNGWVLRERLFHKLRPTAYQQWKIKRNPETPWIDREEVLVFDRAQD